MKTREIRQKIKEHGFDKGVVYILETMNEQLQEINQGFESVATISMKAVELLDKQNATSDALIKQVADLKSREDTSGVSIHSELMDNGK